MEKIFSSKMICVSEGAAMSEARDMMLTYRIRHLPVINSENEVVGMLSSRDLTDIGQYQDLPVEAFATNPVQSVPVEWPLSKVALLMLEKKISSVILCDQENHAVGILTTDDLLFELVRLAKQAEEKDGFESLDPSNYISEMGEVFKKFPNVTV